MPRPGGSAEGGLSGDALAGSCFNAFTHALSGCGAAPTPWDELDESTQAGFARAAHWLEEFFAGEHDEGGSWSALALEAYLECCRGANETPLQAEAIPAPTRIAWEAFCRHASNMIVLDPGEGDGDAATHEEYWNEWARDRKARTTGTRQEADARRPDEE